ncbi:MAG: Leucine dehydrogenase [bacterium]|nr:Leucine dehydrogenase [bacterium]
MEGIFDWMDRYDAEEVRFVRDKLTGMKAIIAIHDSSLGPTLGGVRMRNYDAESDALFDVMRLSQAMTYKCGVIGEDYGGAKAVIWGDPATQKSEAYLRAFGRFIEMTGDRFGTGVDLNLDLQDAAWISRETDRILCHEASAHSTGSSGISAALGVFCGIQALAEVAFGTSDLQGRHVALQGAGALGWPLAEHLHRAGCQLTVADPDPAICQRAQAELQATIVDPASIFDVPCDIFVPAAIGGVLHEGTIERLQCRVLALAANNPLLDEVADEARLLAKGIHFVPDWVINAGGVLQAIGELEGWRMELITRKSVRIGDLCRKVLFLANAEGITPYQAARLLVDRRRQVLPLVRRTYLPGSRD